MIKAVAYYRAASPEGAEMGLQRQKEAVREYAKKIGFEIAAEVEAIESGTSADRDSLRQLKEEVDRTESKVVLTRNIDRIARNPLVMEEVADNLGGVDIRGVEGLQYEDGILKKPDWMRQKEEQVDGYCLKMDVEKFFYKVDVDDGGNS